MCNSNFLDLVRRVISNCHTQTMCLLWNDNEWMACIWSRPLLDPIHNIDNSSSNPLEWCSYCICNDRCCSEQSLSIFNWTQNVATLNKYTRRLPKQKPARADSFWWFNRGRYRHALHLNLSLRAAGWWSPHEAQFVQMRMRLHTYFGVKWIYKIMFLRWITINSVIFLNIDPNDK